MRKPPTSIFVALLVLALSGCVGVVEKPAAPQTPTPAIPAPAPTPEPQPVPAAPPQPTTRAKPSRPTPTAPVTPAPPTQQPRVAPKPAPTPRVPGPSISYAKGELLVGRKEFLFANDENLLRVYPGQSLTRVLKIMSGYRARGWRNPCGVEKRIDDVGQLYTIVFYLSRKPSRSRPMGESRMTPVIFINNRVDSIGRYRTKKLRKSTELVEKQMRGCPH